MRDRARSISIPVPFGPLLQRVGLPNTAAYLIQKSDNRGLGGLKQWRVMTTLPTVIQGGMGAGISNWRLARTVSELGQLGVVSGTALDLIIARRLQDGDQGGHVLRALHAFPFRTMAQRVWDTYYIAGGRDRAEPYKSTPMHSMHSPDHLLELCIVGNFVEVWLAREGHSNPVGINYLEKVQLPHLPSLYGAMLAGVDYVLMGAGIPIKIPGVLDALSQHRTAAYPIWVAGTKAEEDTKCHVRPARTHGVRPGTSETTEVPGYHRVKYAGNNAGEESQRPCGWFRHRRSDGGRSQRAAKR